MTIVDAKKEKSHRTVRPDGGGGCSRQSTESLRMSQGLPCEGLECLSRAQHELRGRMGRGCQETAGMQMQRSRWERWVGTQYLWASWGP